jgi:hypothetical protein
MRYFMAFAVLSIASASATSALATEPAVDHLFLCRSPLLAKDFIGTIEDISNDGVHVTDEIAQQVCDHMRAGSDPQCLRVDAAHLEPFAAGWAGMLAITDGTTRVWFHNPDANGWISPDYFFHHQARLKAEAQ